MFPCDNLKRFSVLNPEVNAFYQAVGTTIEEKFSIVGQSQGIHFSSDGIDGYGLITFPGILPEEDNTVGTPAGELIVNRVNGQAVDGR